MRRSPCLNYGVAAVVLVVSLALNLHLWSQGSKLEAELGEWKGNAEKLESDNQQEVNTNNLWKDQMSKVKIELGQKKTQLEACQQDYDKSMRLVEKLESDKEQEVNTNNLWKDKMSKVEIELGQKKTELEVCQEAYSKSMRLANSYFEDTRHYDQYTGVFFPNGLPLTEEEQPRCKQPDWHVYSADDDWDAWHEDSPGIACVIGEYNAGKTRFICEAFEQCMPRGNDMPTKGLSFGCMDPKNSQGVSKFCFIDAQGHAEAHGTVSKLLEDVQVDVCLQAADVPILVVHEMGAHEEVRIRAYAEDRGREKWRMSNAEFIVVHNFKDAHTPSDIKKEWDRFVQEPFNTRACPDAPNVTSEYFCGLSYVKVQLPDKEERRVLIRHFAIGNLDSEGGKQLNHKAIQKIRDVVFMNSRHMITHESTGWSWSQRLTAPISGPESLLFQKYIRLENRTDVKWRTSLPEDVSEPGFCSGQACAMAFKNFTRRVGITLETVPEGACNHRVQEITTDQSGARGGCFLRRDALETLWEGTEESNFLMPGGLTLPFYTASKMRTWSFAMRGCDPRVESNSIGNRVTVTCLKNRFNLIPLKKTIDANKGGVKDYVYFDHSSRAGVLTIRFAPGADMKVRSRNIKLMLGLGVILGVVLSYYLWRAGPYMWRLFAGFRQRRCTDGRPEEHFHGAARPTGQVVVVSMYGGKDPTKPSENGENWFNLMNMVEARRGNISCAAIFNSSLSDFEFAQKYLEALRNNAQNKQYEVVITKEDGTIGKTQEKEVKYVARCCDGSKVAAGNSSIERPRLDGDKIAMPYSWFLEWAREDFNLDTLETKVLANRGRSIQDCRDKFQELVRAGSDAAAGSGGGTGNDGGHVGEASQGGTGNKTGTVHTGEPSSKHQEQVGEDTVSEGGTGFKAYYSKYVMVDLGADGFAGIYGKFKAFSSAAKPQPAVAPQPLLAGSKVYYTTHVVVGIGHDGLAGLYGKFEAFSKHKPPIAGSKIKTGHTGEDKVSEGSTGAGSSRTAASAGG